MANPFENGNVVIADEIRSQLNDKKSGDTFQMNMIGDDIIRFRANLFEVAKRDGFKVRTRVNETGFYVYIEKSPHDAV